MVPDTAISRWKELTMANTIHYDELRRMLIARRPDLQNEIQNNLRSSIPIPYRD